MLTLAHVVLGALAAAALVLAARRLAPRRELAVYAAGLAVAALIYVGFAVANRASVAWMAIELAGLAAFSLPALTRLKWSPLLLALGWAAHALWDLLLHADSLMHAGGGADAHFVPDWYRLLCVGFDFALAAYLVALSRRAPADADAH